MSQGQVNQSVPMYSSQAAYTSASMAYNAAAAYANATAATTPSYANASAYNPYNSMSVGAGTVSYASGSHPMSMSTPASGSVAPLTQLGFPHSADYTSAVISNSLYDSAAISASISAAAYPQQRAGAIYGSSIASATTTPTVYASNVVAASGSAGYGSNVAYQPKISSRLSGSVRRVLNEFEDEQGQRNVVNYYDRAPSSRLG